MALGKKSKMLIIGPAPVAVGGVAVHIKRLSILLKKDFDITYIDEGRTRFDGYFNLRSLNLARYIKMVKNADVVYINSGSPILRAFNILMCKILLHKNTVVTIHHDIGREKWLIFTKFLTQKCNHLIVVNEETYNVFNGVVNNLHLMPAFIPPVLVEEEKLPLQVEEWLKNIRVVGNSIIMVSNAGNLAIHEGFDLYGLDLCINAIKRLKENGYDNFFLIFVIAEIDSHQQLMREYEREISDNNLSNNILIWNSGLSFVKLIEKADIVLRATNTDGDALTVREALFYGKKVIASDVVKRPEGVLLFKNRDAKDLVRVILNAKDAVSKDDKDIEANLSSYRQKYMDIFNGVK